MKPRADPILNCSFGISFQASSNRRIAKGRLKKTCAIRIPDIPYIDNLGNPTIRKKELSKPLLPKSSIRPKTAEITGRINGRPSNRIICSLRKKFCLNKALEMGIAKQQLKIEDKIACFRVKSITVSSY